MIELQISPSLEIALWTLIPYALALGALPAKDYTLEQLFGTPWKKKDDRS